MNTVAQSPTQVNLQFVVARPSRAEMMAILDRYDASHETWQEMQTGDWYARDRATGSVAAYSSFDHLVAALDEALAEAVPAPVSPIAQAADDLLALVGQQRIAASTRGMLESRLEKAIELAEAGETDFPQYGTGKTDHGLHGNRHCNCPDATYRHLHVSPVGLCCKHTLAQYLAEQVQAEAARVVDRVMIDQIERRPRRDLPTINPADAAEIARDINRETALPASVDQRGSLDDMLGYDEPAAAHRPAYRGETRSLEQQRRDARAGLGGALKPDAANMRRSRRQV